MSKQANPAIVAIHTQRGLARKLADLLNITRPAVSMWNTVPARHAVKVAEALQMPVHLVCPEVFPAPRRTRKHSNATQSVKEN